MITGITVTERYLITKYSQVSRVTSSSDSTVNPAYSPTSFSSENSIYLTNLYIIYERIIIIYITNNIII